MRLFCGELRECTLHNTRVHTCASERISLGHLPAEQGGLSQTCRARARKVATHTTTQNAKDMSAHRKKVATHSSFCTFNLPNACKTTLHEFCVQFLCDAMSLVQNTGATSLVQLLCFKISCASFPRHVSWSFYPKKVPNKSNYPSPLVSHAGK